jgi:hypothetical protein
MLPKRLPYVCEPPAELRTIASARGDDDEAPVQVKLITLAVGDYAQRVQAAAAHGGLPDLLCAIFDRTAEVGRGATWRTTSG